MAREEPVIRKCCFCIPLQTCLQAWACTKVVLDLGITFALAILILALSGLRISFKQFSGEHLILLIMLLLLVDSVFMVVLAVGLCTKNLRTIRVFFFYSLYMVVVGVVFSIGTIMFMAIELQSHANAFAYVACAVGALLNTGADIGIIITLRSEMTKLRNKKQYEFFEMPSLKNEEDSESIQGL